MMDKLRQWTRRKAETPAPPLPAAVPEPPTLDYADQRSADLRHLRRDLAAAQAALIEDEAQWTRLTPRDDPDAHQSRTEIGPRLLTERAEVARLTAAITALERAIADTRIAVADYTAMTDAAAATTAPIVDRLPSDAELTTAFRSSREIESLAAKLLTATGDRQFRRPRVDPHRQIREALEDRLQRLTGLRLVRSRVERKTGTAS